VRAKQLPSQLALSHAQGFSTVPHCTNKASVQCRGPSPPLHACSAQVLYHEVSKAVAGLHVRTAPTSSMCTRDCSEAPALMNSSSLCRCPGMKLSGQGTLPGAIVVPQQHTALERSPGSPGKGLGDNQASVHEDTMEGPDACQHGFNVDEEVGVSHKSLA